MGKHSEPMSTPGMPQSCQIPTSLLLCPRMWLPLPLGTPVAAPQAPKSHQALVEAELERLEGVWAAV